MGPAGCRRRKITRIERCLKQKRRNPRSVKAATVQPAKGAEVPAAVRALRIALPAATVDEDPAATGVALQVIGIAIADAGPQALATDAAKVRPKWISRS
jgi:hypothetical protein